MLAPAFCNVLGSILIIAVFALTLPLSLPRLLGYEVFDVISGSMEPEIPVGSVIYVRHVDPADVQVDEVIAFHNGQDVVAHRVMVNRTSLGEFVTKGDANNVEDPNPASYESLIGVVALHVPFVGSAMSLYASPVGKIYLLLTLACGVMLNILGDRMRRVRSARARKQLQDELAAAEAAAAQTGEHFSPEEQAAALAQAKRGSRRGGGWVRYVVMAVLGLVFMGSAGVVMYVQREYREGDAAYSAASEAYATRAEGEKSKYEVMAPIKVDFDELLKINPDIQGWIYCEGTNIDYPVLRGETNDTYLRHDYKNEYNVRGSIFVDAANRPNFQDACTIIYGHHMSSGTMFAMIEEWENQAFYDEHPYMWLLTPEQDYQVVLISGHHVSAYDRVYDILPEHDAAFQQFLTNVEQASEFVKLEEATVNPDRNYIMMTTCSYIFDSARFVLIGKLVPVASAGGEGLTESVLTTTPAAEAAAGEGAATGEAAAAEGSQG